MYECEVASCTHKKEWRLKKLYVYVAYLLWGHKRSAMDSRVNEAWNFSHSFYCYILLQSFMAFVNKAKVVLDGEGIIWLSLITFL